LKSGVKNEKEILKVYLNYIPVKQNEKINHEMYLSGIAGIYPIAKLFENVKTSNKESTPSAQYMSPREINEIKEEQEPELTSEKQPKINSDLPKNMPANPIHIEEPEPSVIQNLKVPPTPIQPTVPLAPPLKQAPNQDTIELDEDNKNIIGEEAILNESEKNEIQQIDIALKNTVPDEIQKIKDETSGSIIKPKPDTIESALEKTEELISALNAGNIGNFMKNEYEKRIAENTEILINLLDKIPNSQFIEIKNLMKISEIAKKYMDGPNQTKLLGIVLREYRKIQERKVSELSDKKKHIETAEHFEKQYEMLTELIQLFPNENEKINSHENSPNTPIKHNKNSSAAKKAKTTQPKNKQLVRDARKPVPVRKITEFKTENVKKPIKHEQKPKSANKILVAKTTTGKKSADNVRKLSGIGKNTIKTNKIENDEDSWIGNKSLEFDDDEMWEKTGI